MAKEHAPCNRSTGDSLVLLLLLLPSHFSHVQLCATPEMAGFPIPGILQARTLEWVASSFSSA